LADDGRKNGMGRRGGEVFVWAVGKRPRVKLCIGLPKEEKAPVKI
jgi:hypothetical protein